MSQAAASVTPIAVAEAAVRGVLTSSIVVDVVGFFLQSISQREFDALHARGRTVESDLPPAMANAVREHIRSFIRFDGSTQVGSKLTSARDVIVRNIGKIPLATPPPPQVPVAPTVSYSGYSPEAKAAFRRKQHEAALQRKLLRQKAHLARQEQAHISRGARNERRREKKLAKAAKTEETSRDKTEGASAKPTGQHGRQPRPELLLLRQQANRLASEIGQLKREVGVGRFIVRPGRENSLVWTRRDGQFITTPRLNGLQPSPPWCMVRLLKSGHGLAKNPYLNEKRVGFTYLDAAKVGVMPRVV